jgi:hypothetical protein
MKKKMFVKRACEVRVRKGCDSVRSLSALIT